VESPKVFPPIDQMAETEKEIVGADAEAAETQVAEKPEVEIPKMPYDADALKAIHNFFQSRTKRPGQYVFNAAGNLEIKEGPAKGKGKSKDAPGIITLQRFVPLDPSERAAIDEARMVALTELDQAYEDEFLTLQDAWDEYSASGAMRGVLASNQRLTDIDARRNAARSAVRTVMSIPNPPVRDIILSEKYEERKMFEPKDPFDKAVARLCFYTYPLEVDQGKYVPDEDAAAEEKEAEDEADADKANEMLYRQRLKDGRAARIFYDTDSDVNGFLSPMWTVDFTMAATGGDMRFSSPIQAYEVERTKELGNDELAATLLKTRSPRTIRLLTRKVTGHPKDARGLWMKIYTAVYEQHPILKAKLLDTGSDTLVFADVREGPSGIGLSEKDSAALDPARWKGENAAGVAQETVRTRLREGTQAEAPEAKVVQGGSITEEEQQKAKVAAIINARRHGGGFRR
jgi:predicted NAD-dependent protein-ADP-ribosyltransferase YbiA (DUF1768 family)